MSDCHIQFGTFCEAVAGGALTEAGIADLESHCAECRECREERRAMELLSGELILAGALAERVGRPSKGMCDRFIERANREGIPLKPRAERFNFGYAPLLSAFVLVVVAVCIAYAWRGPGSSQAREANVAEAGGGGFLRDGRDLSGDDRGAAMKVEARNGDGPRRYKRRGGNSRMRAATRGGSALRAGAPAPDFVMYSPRPRFANYAIPSSSTIAEGEALKPWLEREPSEVGRAFLLKNQKLLLEASSDPHPVLVQYASLLDGRLDFRFNPSDYRETQVETH